MDRFRDLHTALQNGNLSRREVMQKVCQYTCQIIPSANLVSLWRFDPERSKIISLINYDATNESFTEGLVLTRDQYPEYFSAIIENELVVASNARENRATRCFNERYFEPFNIYSLLDFILHKNFRPVGVICCESKGEQVEWSQQDIDKIRSIATMISYCFDF